MGALDFISRLFGGKKKQETNSEHGTQKKKNKIKQCKKKTTAERVEEIKLKAQEMSADELYRIPKKVLKALAKEEQWLLGKV